MAMIYPVKARRAVLVLLATILMVPAARAIQQAPGRAPRFTYAGGTQGLRSGCAGELELTHTSMTFACPEGSITIPFRSVVLMQYRPKVSRSITQMKLPWKVKPSGSGRKKNLFFTVLYREDRRLRAMVLKVRPDDMRPYLAQIELSTGKRIHVWDYRGFE